jgi:hypothetical protein
MEKTRNLVLEAMLQHETLTLDSLEKQETLGPGTNLEQLQMVLSELVASNYLTLLNGVSPETYTITDTGIMEGKKLADAQHLNITHSFGYGTG